LFGELVDVHPRHPNVVVIVRLRDQQHGYVPEHLRGDGFGGVRQLASGVVREVRRECGAYHDASYPIPELLSCLCHVAPPVRVCCESVTRSSTGHTHRGTASPLRHRLWLPPPCLRTGRDT